MKVLKRRYVGAKKKKVWRCYREEGMKVLNRRKYEGAKEKKEWRREKSMEELTN